MRLPGTLPTALVLAVFTWQNASAQEIREERVRFPAGGGGTTIHGSITGSEIVSYRVGAEAGQELRLRLYAAKLSAYFNVYAPGSGPGDTAMARSGLDGAFVPEINRFDATLPVSGEYTVTVYLMRAAARREERSDFTLDISLAGATAAIVEADFADGLQGGPDFWEVRVEDRLNLRSGPSTDIAVVASLGSGQILRNLGCRMAEGRHWCHVVTPDGEADGWVAGAYLSEASDFRDAAGKLSRAEDLQLAPGGPPAMKAGSLASGEVAAFGLSARAGQTLAVDLRSEGEGMFFTVFAPDGSEIYRSPDGVTGSYHGQVSIDGAYGIAVQAAAPDSEPAPYEIGIALE